jgi:hypothetical protein
MLSEGQTLESWYCNAFRLLHDLGLAAPIAFHLHKVELGFPTPRKRRCFPLAPRNVLDLSDVGTRQLKSRSVVQCHRQRWPYIWSDLWGLYPDPSTYFLDNPSSLEFDDDGPERGCNQAKPSAAPYR